MKIKTRLPTHVYRTKVPEYGRAPPVRRRQVLRETAEARREFEARRRTARLASTRDEYEQILEGDEDALFDYSLDDGDDWVAEDEYDPMDILCSIRKKCRCVITRLKCSLMSFRAGKPMTEHERTDSSVYEKHGPPGSIR